VGKELEAITLHTPAELAACDRTLALSENFLPIEIAGHLEANRLVRLHVARLNADGTLEAVLMNKLKLAQYEATAMSV
jgi:hypothetical protein